MPDCLAHQPPTLARVDSVVHHDRVVQGETAVLDPVHRKMTERVQSPALRLWYAVPAEVTHVRVEIDGVGLARDVNIELDGVPR